MSGELYTKSKNMHTRWASFENPKGEKSGGGMENGKAKGSAFRPLGPGESHVLLDTEGSGTVDRIWLTMSKRTPEILRSLKIEMFWDGCEKPAVSVPLGDFFGASLGICRPFETAFLSNPEGRSFNSFFKMPFLHGAKIIVTNESTEHLKHFFYDICYTLCPVNPSDILYFHAYWNRENPNKLTRDYTVLPRISGEGKFIGMNVGVILDKIYGDSWFGEGEMKIYMDGDDEYPTLCGTGTEDYIGTAWGQGEFSNLTQGCLVANTKKGLFTFYRFHKPDPIYFYSDILVQLQVIGGDEKYNLLRLADRNVPHKIVSVEHDLEFHQLNETEFKLERNAKDGWYNFYREDDFSSVAYFYYDKPDNSLPQLPSINTRVDKISNVDVL